MPSGVTTAMPLSTPAAVPAVHKHHLRATAGAGSDDARRQRPGRRAGLKRGQRLGAVGGGQLGFQVLVLHLEPVEVRLQPPVFLARIVQKNVVLKESGSAAPHALQHAGQRRYGGDRPYADQAHVLVVPDLLGEQQQLREQSPEAGR